MGGDYNNKKDYYKPYPYYSSYSGKNDGGGSGNNRGNNGADNNKRSSSNMRPYSSPGGSASSASSSNSYYPPKRSSMFSKSQGSYYSGSGYGYNNNSSSNSMFSNKRKYNGYQPYNSNRSRGSVYIHDSQRNKSQQKKDGTESYIVKSDIRRPPVNAIESSDHDVRNETQTNESVDKLKSNDKVEDIKSDIKSDSKPVKAIEEQPKESDKPRNAVKMHDKLESTKDIVQPLKQESVSVAPIQKSPKMGTPTHIPAFKKKEKAHTSEPDTMGHKPLPQHSELKRTISASSIDNTMSDHKKPKVGSPKVGSPKGKEKLTAAPKKLHSSDKLSIEHKVKSSKVNSDDIRKYKNKHDNGSPAKDSAVSSKHGDKIKRTDSDGKKQKIKEVVKKFELNKDPNKKHSLFKDNKPKVKPASTLMKKSDLFKDKTKKSSLFKDVPKKHDSHKDVNVKAEKKNTPLDALTRSNSDSPKTIAKVKSEHAKREDGVRSVSPDQRLDKHEHKSKKEEHKPESDNLKKEVADIKSHKDIKNQKDLKNSKEKSQKEVNDRKEILENKDHKAVKEFKHIKQSRHSTEPDKHVKTHENTIKSRIRIIDDDDDEDYNAPSEVENVPADSQQLKDELLVSQEKKIDAKPDETKPVITEDLSIKDDAKGIKDDAKGIKDTSIKEETKLETDKPTNTDSSEVNKNMLKTNKEIPEDKKLNPSEPLSPRQPYTATLRSSPLSDINLSHQSSDDEDGGINITVKKTRGHRQVPEEPPIQEVKEEKDIVDMDTYKNRATLELKEYENDQAAKNQSDEEEEAYSSGADDNSEAETVIADYPPRSRRGRGRLVRKSEYHHDEKPSLSRSGERKRPSDSQRATSSNRKTRVGRDASGRLKLQRACDKGKYDIAEQLIKEGADVNDTDYAGNSSLHEAALKGHYDIAKLLIKHGADVNIQSGPEDLDTPLIDAAANGHLDVVKLLLEHGANPNISNAVNENIYELLKDSDEPGSEALLEEVLKKRNEFSEVKRDHLMSDASSNENDSEDEHHRQHSRSSRYVQSRNDLFWMDLTSRSGRNEIYKKAAEGDYAFVGKYLSGGGKADVDCLIIASRNGHMDIVSILLAFGAEINGVAEDGTTALMHAVGRNHLDIVKLLLSSGADPLKKRKSDGKTALEICQESVLADQEEIYLLKRKTSDVDDNKSIKRKDSSVEFHDKEEKSSKLGLHKTKKRKLETTPEGSESPDIHKQSPKDNERKSKFAETEDKKRDEALSNDKKHEAFVDGKKHDGDKRSRSVEKVKKSSERPNLKPNKTMSATKVPLKTSKLFSSKDERKPSVGDLKAHAEKVAETKAKEQSKKKEAYEQQKAEKIRARQQAVLLRISQAEKQREEERKLQKLHEEEKRKQGQLEAERKEKELKERLLEQERQKEIALKKKIRESYPYSLQCVNFYDYDVLSQLNETDQQAVLSNTVKFLPLYYVIIDNEKWVVDLQISLISGLVNIYEKAPALNDSKSPVTTSQQRKLWNFFSSLLLKAPIDYPPVDESLFNGLSALDKRLEVFRSEGKKFQLLVLNWVRLSVVESQLIKKHEFLKKWFSPEQAVEMDYSYLNDESLNHITTLATERKAYPDTHLLFTKIQIPQNCPRKFQGRFKALNVIDSTKKNLW